MLKASTCDLALPVAITQQTLLPAIVECMILITTMHSGKCQKQCIVDVTS